MQSMSVDQLRNSYLEFFQSKAHRRLPSASLVPHGDPTLLLTAAGMVPFKPYFLGVEEPPVRRVTTCQRCLRTPDIENVGITDRHGTFFEMLGNFSFGDYFKREAIAFAWEFVTKGLQVDPSILWITIYLDDDEAFDIWHKEIGVPAERIVRLGKEDNFWSIGVGPCGPCSEIHIDRGPAHGCGAEDCKPGCDCDRFMELWNLVFVQYHQDEEGTLHPLERPGVDTGMGLERVAAMLQGVKSIFDTDIMQPIISHVAKTAGVEYGESAKADVSLRVITDHMRGVTFMVLDGMLPSNEGRGYVLRRLLRRAVRHARLLGIEQSFLPEMVEVVARQMQVGYPELEKKVEYIKRVVSIEEERFHDTLDQGMEILERLIASVKEQGEGISGEDAFRLHDTYGFPLELTEEIAADRGVTVDKEGFSQAMEEQRARARAARSEAGYLGGDQGVLTHLSLPLTEFVGYTSLRGEGEILAMVESGEEVGRLSGEGEADIVLSSTPFYAEGGGQVADRGTLAGPNGTFQVESVFRVGKGLIVHRGSYHGELEAGAKVTATVTESPRLGTQRNHTATHLLHRALRESLGEHVAQAGSLVTPDRLRFDFTHFEAISPESLREVERQVNARILRNLPVSAQVLPYDEAVTAGAMALFGEKYGDEVRMVSVEGYSRELCGGTHVNSTGEIGQFRIVSEGGIASGVRRIEAVTGEGAFRYGVEETETLASAAAKLQVAPRAVPQQIEKLLGELKQAERQLQEAKAKMATSQLDELISQAREVDGIRILAATVEGLDMKALRQLGDQLKERLGPSALALGIADQGKAQVVVMVTDEAVQKGVHAGNVVKNTISPLIDGKGGGRPTMAQAGGSNTTGLPEAMKAAAAAFAECLSGQPCASR